MRTNREIWSHLRLYDLAGFTVVHGEQATERVKPMQLPPGEGPKIQGQSIQQSGWHADGTGTRQEKVAKLQKAIASGSYRVSPQTIAQKMLNSGILNSNRGE